MNKDELISALESLRGDLDKLRKILRSSSATNVYNSETKNIPKATSRMWFENIKQALPSFGVSRETASEYSVYFKNLAKAALPRAKNRNAYLKILDEIQDRFNDSLLLPVLVSAGEIINVSHLEKILEKISDDDEREYLEQAIGCAHHNFLSASVVMGWCAAVNRMHRIIENKWGFPRFTQITEEMVQNKKGLYKTFRMSYEVSNLGDLRQVPDRVTMFALKHEGLVTANQYKKLDKCLLERNLAAHPGETKTNPEDLASFYRNLKDLVFDNSKFEL